MDKYEIGQCNWCVYYLAKAKFSRNLNIDNALDRRQYDECWGKAAKEIPQDTPCRVLDEDYGTLSCAKCLKKWAEVIEQGKHG